jgi:uncharacterized membrane protein YkoI
MRLFSFILFVIVVSFSHINMVVADNHKSKISQSNLRVKSSQQAAQLVKGRFGGKVLKVKKSGQTYYRVKLVKKDGHVLSILVNAKTGQLTGK